MFYTDRTFLNNSIVIESKGSRNSLFCNTDSGGKSLARKGKQEPFPVFSNGSHRRRRFPFPDTVGNRRGEAPCCSPVLGLALIGWSPSSNHAGSKGDGSPSVALQHKYSMSVCQPRKKCDEKISRNPK